MRLQGPKDVLPYSLILVSSFPPPPREIMQGGGSDKRRGDRALVESGAGPPTCNAIAPADSGHKRGSRPALLGRFAFRYRSKIAARSPLAMQAIHGCKGAQRRHAVRQQEQSRKGDRSRARRRDG